MNHYPDWRVTTVDGQRCIVNELGGLITRIDDDCLRADLLAAAPRLLEALRAMYAEYDHTAPATWKRERPEALAKSALTLVDQS